MMREYIVHLGNTSRLSLVYVVCPFSSKEYTGETDDNLNDWVFTCVEYPLQYLECTSTSGSPFNVDSTHM